MACYCKPLFYSVVSFAFIFSWIATSAAAGGIVHHSDLLVAVGDRLDLVTANGTTGQRVQLPSYNASKIVALAYDPLTGKLFFSDTKKMRGHIFSFRLSLVDEQPLTKDDDTVLDIVEMVDNKESVEGLSYDSVEETLTWTDGLKGSVRRVRIDHDRIGIQDTNSIEVVHLLENDKPRSLISDPCTRMLYWANWNQKRPSIERSFINGSNRQTIVRENLFMPHGLGLDIRHQKLYWANNMRSTLYQIERSDADGSNRELIHKGRGHFIFGLTVGEDYIYWTDREEKTLWALPKEGSNHQPQALRKYQQEPLSVIVVQQQPLDCSQIDISRTNDVEDVVLPAPPKQELESVVGCTEGYCFNGGKCVTNSAAGTADEFHCSCLGNYGGDRCDELLLTEPAIESASSTCRLEALWQQQQSPFASTGTTLWLITGLCVVCLILMMIVLYLALWLRRLVKNQRKAGFRRRKLIKNSMDNDIENCCTIFTLCERPGSCKKETVRDTADLLNHQEC